MSCKGVLKSAVSGDFGRQVLDAAGAAALAQDVAVQRVAASALAFRGQQEAAFLVVTRAKSVHGNSAWHQTASGVALTSQT